MIEMTADGKPPIQKKDIETSYTSEVYFESMFLGHIPANGKTSKNVGHICGFRGCIWELQVNNKEFSIIDEAQHGRNIENCHVPWCARHLCQNNGACISDSEDWFCECPRLYSGKLCQFATCENNPCGNGATCVPKLGTDIVCLCPYGRSGPFCTDAVAVTQPRFSGTDDFGYTSFLAYSRVSDISSHHEFHLKFQLANNHSALQNNLIFFTGQKGHGLDGDDFLAVGLLTGRVVYTYNLGSGVARIRSEPLDLSLGIHTVRLGRSFREGWLKVDDHKNKSVIGPGRLVGLNVFSEFYVGGYSEYTPGLLPNGANFKNGFQDCPCLSSGCIFTVQARTEKDGRFRGLGNPEGHPSSGRSVGQCGATPCGVVECHNGGTCADGGSTVYCHYPTGWRGALCAETVSPCDPEHDPPHRCNRGATCIPSPQGYACHCPLGTTGSYCEQGDFLCISLVNGSIQLRYNLGDRTITLETLQKVATNGSTWHMVKAGRFGAGYLDLDGIRMTEKASTKMSILDTNTDFYIGGVSSLNRVNPSAIANEPVGFHGCVQEVIINNQELQLTELGAKGGSNVGDCDGTACGTTETDSLIIWMGKAQNEDNDFPAIGLHNQTLKIAVNLGERIAVPMSYSNDTFCCNKWHHVAIIQNQTLIKAYVNNSLILFEDIDPNRRFTALNYDGICYLGGFEYGRKLVIKSKKTFYVKSQGSCSMDDHKIFELPKPHSILLGYKFSNDSTPFL
ncbi:protein eyes shut homolog [Carlito syrichta]|uniref:Protein eyes shut homolog n=1 Tax=Carlito syrichta TaxID=1868482 RepID=A0A1U7T4K6_CARSF|nr:protein eyes shut homolog [Carlito syrichta]